MSFFRKPTPLPVTQGGTGNVFASSGYALIGNGYSALLELTPSTSGNLMTSNGTTWTSAPPSAGGTVTSVAQSFTGGLISVSGSPVTTTGTLALTVAGTSGGIPYFSSASTWATSAALTQYGVVYGGGAGATPVATAAGTTGQVLTATTSGAPTWATASGGFSQAQIFTASGSFTVPASGKFKVTIIGGGGSGGSYSSSSFAGSSAGGGGNVIKWFTGATPSATATVTIGAGGTVVSGNVDGNTGGASTFVLSGFSTLTASGGVKGLAGGNQSGGAGGAASGGDINVQGQRGGAEFVDSSGLFRTNNTSLGGSSLMGFGGVVMQYTGTGQSGSGYGGGGTGVTAGGTSGAGTGGICIVEY